jgi:N-acetylneuraminate synthase
MFGEELEICLGGRWIGPSQSPFIVAELSGNHGGNLDKALTLIRAAKEAGADAVKLQTYTADSLTLDHDGPGFRIEGGLWAGRRLHELYQEAATPWDWHEPLFSYARSLDIIAFSSPFDGRAVELLSNLDCPAYKIASFELIDHDLIRHAAGLGRPLILSTGMASLGEIEEAIGVAREVGNTHLVLLHCVSGYPTPPAESDLRTLPHLAATFGFPVGLSDHSLGIGVPVAAVALGAVMIEKHFTLSRAEGGVDAGFSLEPEEFRQMAEACRTAWSALGQVNFDLKPSEAGGRAFRRSLYVVADMAAGEVFTPHTVRSIRPGHGLLPKFFPQILGRRAAVAIPRGTPLNWNLLA